MACSSKAKVLSRQDFDDHVQRECLRLSGTIDRRRIVALEDFCWKLFMARTYTNRVFLERDLRDLLFSNPDDRRFEAAIRSAVDNIFPLIIHARTVQSAVTKCLSILVRVSREGLSHDFSSANSNGNSKKPPSRKRFYRP